MRVEASGLGRSTCLLWWVRRAVQCSDNMSDPHNDSEDLLLFFLYFFLTCLAVLFVILTLFLCFSGRICVFMYYMVYNVQVQNIGHIS